MSSRYPEVESDFVYCPRCNQIEEFELSRYAPTSNGQIKMYRGLNCGKEIDESELEAPKGLEAKAKRAG